MGRRGLVMVLRGDGVGVGRGLWETESHWSSWCEGVSGWRLYVPEFRVVDMVGRVWD